MDETEENRPEENDDCDDDCEDGVKIAELKGGANRTLFLVRETGNVFSLLLVLVLVLLVRTSL